MNDKKVKQANIIAWVSLIIVLLLVIATLFIKNEKVGLLTVSVMMIPILALITSSYVVYKERYKEYTQTFMIPRIYGIGWSINPNNTLGRVVWGVITLLIVGLMIYLFILAL